MRFAVDAKWYHRGPAGVHTYIRELIGALRDLGTPHQFDVYLRPGEPAPFSEPDDRWHFHPLWPSLSSPRVWWALPRAQRRLPVDLFFTQSLAPLTRRAPRCVTVHDVLWHDFPEHFTWRERMHFRLIDGAVRRAEMVVTDSEHSRERICATSGRRPEDVHVVPLGVSPRYGHEHDPAAIESLRARLGLPERFILYVGRLNRRKNLPTLLRAVARLPEPWPLVCAGGGDWKQDDLEPLISELGLSERTHLTGRVPGEDLPLLYAMATVFAYIPFAEGFGIPPLEAMASGAPVLASNATSVPEVVGDAAILVNPNRPDEVAGKLSELLDDEALRAELSRRGRARARGFTWEATARKMVALWEQLA